MSRGNVAVAFSQARQSAASFSASSAARGFGSAAMAQRAVGVCRGRWRRKLQHGVGMEVYFLLRSRPCGRVGLDECYSFFCVPVLKMKIAGVSMRNPNKNLCVKPACTPLRLGSDFVHVSKQAWASHRTVRLGFRGPSYDRVGEFASWFVAVSMVVFGSLVGAQKTTPIPWITSQDGF